jgi:hypothetical protein
VADRIFVGKAQGHEALVHNRHLLSGCPSRSLNARPRRRRRPSVSLPLSCAPVRATGRKDRRGEATFETPTRSARPSVIREKSKRRPSPSSSAGSVGLNTSDASRDYIHLYRGDREPLSGSLDRIQRAASMILAAVNAGG